MFGHCFHHMTPLPRIVYILNLYEMNFYCILRAILLISSYVYLIIALCLKCIVSGGLGNSSRKFQT